MGRAADLGGARRARVVPPLVPIVHGLLLLELLGLLASLSLLHERKYSLLHIVSLSQVLRLLYLFDVVLELGRWDWEL